MHIETLSEVPSLILVLHKPLLPLRQIPFLVLPREYLSGLAEAWGWNESDLETFASEHLNFSSSKSQL